MPKAWRAERLFNAMEVVRIVPCLVAQFFPDNTVTIEGEEFKRRYTIGESLPDTARTGERAGAVWSQVEPLQRAVKQCLEGRVDVLAARLADAHESLRLLDVPDAR